MGHSEDANRDRLRRFMALWSHPERKPKPCGHFKLWHKGEDKNEAVTNGEISLGGPDEGSREREIAELVEIFHDEATQNAGGFPRRQYYVVACYPDGKPNTIPKAQSGFWCDGLDTTDAEGFSDGGEEITGQSVLALTLKSIQVKEHQASVDVQRARESVDKANQRVDDMFAIVVDRNKQLEDRNLALSAALQDSLDRQALRATTAYGEKKKIDREDRIWQLLESQLPKILDRWGGGPLGALVKSLRAEQVLALYPTLDPEQKAALAVAAETYGIDIKQLAAGGGSHVQ